MTDLASIPVVCPERVARPHRYLMTPPMFFAVEYAINPWMTVGVPVDRSRALLQWTNLVDTYRRLGHRVDVLQPVPGLPDMVYAANGALVAPTATIGARFAYSERAAEAPVYASWLEAAGLGPVLSPSAVNEGEGDFLIVGSEILAGTGFRTTTVAHAEVAQLTGLPVTTLELVDPRYYHLDTALAVLDERTIAYFPGAFSVTSQATLVTMFPDAVIATAEDAAVLGLNLVSDGRHVVLCDAARDLAAAIEQRGFQPIPIDLSELLKGGGGIKCCTLEIRREEVAT